MDLSTHRQTIDQLDKELVSLFQKRMEVCRQIAQYKQQHGLPVLDAGREREKLAAVCAMVEPEMRSYTSVLYSSLFELSRSYQGRILEQVSLLKEQITKALDETPKLFPRDVSVAVCGVEGAYAETACEKLFPHGFVSYFNSFDAVFNAIEQGFCQYGVVPIENSTAGSVKQVYDLMTRHNFSIVRSVRLKVDHSLLALPGAKLDEIREIYSHEQAISQCSKFLQSLGNDVKIIPVENTAKAAQMVAQSGRKDAAALCAKRCAELYGLSCLRHNVQNQGNNYTRFLCISRNLEIYPGADRTTIMLSTSHRPGALYKVLSRFYALDINITKLESRPIPDRDFEFMFYLDLETSVYSDEFIQLICELSATTEEFTYLGSYSEVIG